MDSLIPALRNLLDTQGPKLLHITTVKGKGFAPAEKDPVGYHAINKIESPEAKAEKKVVPGTPAKKYQQIFGDWLCDLAAQEEKQDRRDLAAITPAMCEGSGMVEFSRQYPDRYYDVAIAEQHAVTLAAGMATGGKKPVVAIYSTFLQRAYDQLVHDVALQNLDVTFGIDRAGLVGEDGPSHAGAYDLSYLRCIPNMVVMTPSNECEARLLLQTGYEHPGPAAIRYPRGTGPNADIIKALETVSIGKAVVRQHGHKVALLAFGTLLNPALPVCEDSGYTLVDMRFVKPLDESLISSLAADHELLVTLEENATMGGAGSAVSEYLNASGANVPLLQLGLPDSFIDHGKHGQMLANCGLDSEGIAAAIERKLAQLAADKTGASPIDPAEALQSSARLEAIGKH